MRSMVSWGRLSSDQHHVTELTDRFRLSALMCSEKKLGLPYGMGRSYGDVCLNAGGALWVTTGLDHFISFDKELGILVCEAGVLLRDIQRLAIPYGWILPVTPGTQLITVGGAIANDVHGKNHHREGSFGEHVRSLVLARTNGEVLHCGQDHRSDWFAATVGGLGLTGVIVQAEIQLQRVSGPWLDTETIPYHDLVGFFDLADSSENDWEHTVSWVDCFSGGGGRGLFMRGNSVEVQRRTISKQRSVLMPIVPPFSLVNRMTLRPFNIAYYHWGRLRGGRRIVHYEPFFYPLDNIHQWNRMYGPKGFFQYQSVVPRDVGQDAVQSMLAEISRSGEGSFLAVLKTFGDRQAPGMLSFTKPGVTLALDFPNRGVRTLKLFEKLDAIVREARGRLYPAKDARMPKELFYIGYPRLEEFLKYRDPGISSNFSRRVLGD